MTMSPASRAIGIAAFVIAAALALYAVAATADRWPSLVIAAWGAALGAGMAINGIARREMEVADAAAAPDARLDRTAALQHQICTAIVALAAWQTAERESAGWAAVTMISAVAWAWTFPRLVAQLERAPLVTCLRAYATAFQTMAVLAAIACIYGSIALDTAWLWRPAVPAHLQAFVWLAILEFPGLPLTLVAVAPLTPGRLRGPL